MLTGAAFQAGLEAAQGAGRDAQREMGQFMTPGPIAEFMAKRAVAGRTQPVVRLLEPAAGAGVLIASAVQALITRDVKPTRIEIVAFELDAELMPLLQRTCVAAVEFGRANCVEVKFVLRNEDFLLSELALAGTPVADLVIANPPYFKLPASDPRATAHPYALFGQPNIYGLFMAACARLVRPGGSYCSITPRSWANGPYFSAVRRTLFERLSVQALHLFDSRRDSFREDEVLQETMILWACAQASPRVSISFSAGIGDIEQGKAHEAAPDELIRGADHVLMLPRDSEAPEWDETLGSLGLMASTGPTVAFRAREHLCGGAVSGAVPLLWMQHLRRDGITWPLRRADEQIRVNVATSWMLLRSAPMVLFRRFSPKEDLRRMTAAAYLGELPCDYLAIENHINYVHRKGGSMSTHEAVGLAAVLNSDPVDRYLRSLSGNTQINAADLRHLPLPSLDAIEAIGRALGSPRVPLNRVDEVVGRLGVVASRIGRSAA